MQKNGNYWYSNELFYIYFTVESTLDMLELRRDIQKHAREIRLVHVHGDDSNHTTVQSGAIDFRQIRIISLYSYITQLTILLIYVHVYSCMRVLTVHYTA